MRLELVERKDAEVIVNGKQHWKQFQEIKSTKGKYMVFGSVVESFGIMYSRRLAIKYAVNYCTKCLLLGGEWNRWDNMADATEFYRISREHSSNCEETWQLFEKEYTVGQVQATEDEDPVVPVVKDGDMEGGSDGAGGAVKRENTTPNECL